MMRRLFAGAILAGSLALAVPAHAVDCPPAWGPRSIDLGVAAVTYCWPITPER